MMTVNENPTVDLTPDTIIGQGQSLVLEAGGLPGKHYDLPGDRQLGRELHGERKGDRRCIQDLEDAVKISAFAIYDRWGARVFYTTNSGAGWDGNFGGQPQLAGTYMCG